MRKIFFQQLQDVGENPVSKRQQVILRENLSSLVVEIQVLPEGRKGGREYSGRISRGGKGEGDLYGAGTNAPVAGKSGHPSPAEKDLPENSWKDECKTGRTKSCASRVYSGKGARPSE